MTQQEELHAWQWASIKQCLLYERLSHILKDIITQNKIELTKEQIKNINAYDTWNIRVAEHRDEMWLDTFPNGEFFKQIKENARDDVLVYL